MNTSSKRSSQRSNRRNSNILTKTALAVAVVGGLAGANAALAADDLTWNGITLYGVVDVGVTYESHGAPLSQDWGNGLFYIISKASDKSITTISQSGLSQSRLGLRGKENVTDGLDFIFNAEMGFNPTSGRLSDGPASLIHNNGVALTSQKSAADSSRAGQLFNGPAFAGFSSKDLGTLTIGRHNTLLLDNIGKYDPMNGSYALSIIGYSGTASGGGDTENARADGSVKYNYKNGMFRFGALYQFGKSEQSPGEAWQGTAGFDIGGFSVDGTYARKKDAIALASLSAAQLVTLPRESLAATISDNEAWNIGASYIAGPLKVSGGYEHIKYQNPSLPVAAGFSGVGGYWISVTNNAPFPHDKTLNISWIGAKYNFTKDFDITGAWYHYDQNAFGAVKCSTAAAANCSGNEDVYSVRLDYRLTKRLDVDAGAAWSKVSDGLASGFLHTSTVDPTVGVRFQF
ncbi:MAG: porin [Rudaea sp.]